MKALITGASGFIGSNLLRAVLNSSIFHEVRTLGRRVLRTEHEKHTQHYQQDLARECDIEGWLPDVVFHLAASAVPRNAKADAIENNVIGTFNLLQNLRDCHVVYASSVTVYGDYMYRRIRSNDNLHYQYSEVDRCRPTSIYGITKLTSEHLLRVACEQRPGLTGVSLRLCANVGKGNTHGILRDFIRKVQADEDYFEIIGDEPGSIKPFLHVDDASGALMHFATARGGTDYNQYNIAGHGSLSAKDIAKIVLKKYESNKKVRWLGESANWPGDNKLIRVTTEKAKIAGWSPAYPNSADAVAAAIDNYRSEI